MKKNRKPACSTASENREGVNHPKRLVPFACLWSLLMVLMLDVMVLILDVAMIGFAIRRLVLNLSGGSYFDPAVAIATMIIMRVSFSLINYSINNVRVMLMGYMQLSADADADVVTRQAIRRFLENSPPNSADELFTLLNQVQQSAPHCYERGKANYQAIDRSDGGIWNALVAWLTHRSPQLN